MTFDLRLGTRMAEILSIEQVFEWLIRQKRRSGIRSAIRGSG